MVYYFNNENEKANQLVDTVHQTVLDLIIQGMAGYWMEIEMSNQFISLLKERCLATQKSGLKWLELEATTILSKIVKKSEDKENYAKRAEALAKETGIQSMITAVKKVEQWEKVLRSLEAITTGTKGTTSKQEGETRIVWLVDFINRRIQPKEQLSLIHISEPTRPY